MTSDRRPDIWCCFTECGDHLVSATMNNMQEDLELGWSHYIPASRLAELEAKHARLLELARDMARRVVTRDGVGPEDDTGTIAASAFRSEFGSQGGA